MRALSDLAPGGDRAPGEGYFALSRSHFYSLTFALPLLVAYEILVLAMDRMTVVDVRNGADVLLRGAFARLGVPGPDALLALLVAGAAVLIARERRARAIPWRPVVFGAMLAESTAWALLFGMVVSRLTAMVLSGTFLGYGLQAARLSLGQQLVLSLGAGLYEELVFRVLLVSGLAWLLARLPGTTNVTAGLGAVMASAFIFSAFHYVGPLGDAFSVASFTFRFLAGLAFSLIYWLRGFGIVAWSHALYDVFLLIGG